MGMKKIAGPNETPDSARLAGVELGGTKIVCGLARADGGLLERVQIDTQAPDLSLPRIREVLETFIARHGPFAALGIGTFGPVCLDRSAPGYGRLGPTPKIPWRGCDLSGFFGDLFSVPVVIDTDVNAAAMGEVKWGAAVGCDPVVYITVGTGIGGGVLAGGQPVHGLLHPELGHMHVPRAMGDTFRGSCPSHADCVEGMAAGSAIVERWGKRLDELPPGHPAYAQTAHYLGHLVTNAILTVSPEKIVLGGGVMDSGVLLPLIRRNVRLLLNGFIAVDPVERGIDKLIVSPGLGVNSGLLGAIALAQQA